MAVELTYPFTQAAIRALRTGQRVSINGRIFTGRDRLHKYVCEGNALPVDFADGAIYHCGPVMLRRGSEWVVCSAGPTTSMRQEPYTAHMIRERGVRIVIGKGGMGEATRRACAECGCVYMQAVGGAAALQAATVKRVDGVYFLKEFGCADALWDLYVEGFEVIVAIDTRGRSLQRRVQRASKRKLQQLFDA
jgi:tartrate/fumarate subfamily iron-sulfur-dependent hydro-lyase beta chain